MKYRQVKILNLQDRTKRYEFGFIPTEWDLKKIGEIFSDIKGGSTPSRKVKEYYEGNIPWITSGELKYKRIYDTNEKITEAAVKDTNLVIYPKGTFFIAITGLEAEGTRGGCAITEVEATTNQSCLAFRPKSGLSNQYFFHWYRMYGDTIAFKYAQGTKQQSLNNKIVQEIEIAVPPIKEQQKIADILSTVDEQIEDTESLIQKTKELKKGLMQRLLTKGIGHKEFKETEIGVIPKEWKVKNLGELFKVASGNFLSQKNIIEGPYPVYGGNGIAGYHNEYLFEEPCVVIGRVGAKCGCIHISNPKSWITDNALYISNKKMDFDDYYMFYLLSNIDLNQYANQSAQPVISGQKIYELTVALPDLDEQREIATILTQTDQLIGQIEEKKTNLQELKQALMQKLLTGKIRVRV